MTEEQILGSAGGDARKPVDFTYEVALINRRIAARLKSEEPPAMPQGEAWIVAPEELQSKAAIIEYMTASSNELLEAAKALPESDAAKMIGAPGKEEPAYTFVSFATMHTMYHDAQLNFIQSLAGDLKVHWG